MVRRSARATTGTFKVGACQSILEFDTSGCAVEFDESKINEMLRIPDDD